LFLALLLLNGCSHFAISVREDCIGPTGFFVLPLVTLHKYLSLQLSYAKITIVTKALFFTALLCTAFAVNAQKVNEPSGSAAWSQPYPPFRIVGNVYYVGTYDLACYLITTSEGHILVNTGLAASADIIRKNIETLGFRITDVKILTTNQAHYDHVGALAALQKMSGAKIMADSKDASVLSDGGKSDYELSKYGVSFEPVKVDRPLNDNDVIGLGDTKITLLHHPGHTKGSCSFAFDTKDDNKTYRVLIANLPTIVTSRKLSDIPEYPGIATDLANTISAQKQLTFDIWLAAHASQVNLHEKHKPGDPYNPQSFVDRPGYDQELKELEGSYEKKLKQK